MEFQDLIPAARALLKWSQADLAERAGIAMGSIVNAEKGGAIIRKTETRIKSTLEMAGIEFLPSGVSLRRNAVFELNGSEGLQSLQDMIYRSCVENPKSRVLVNNMRQADFNKWASEYQASNRERLQGVKDMPTWHILLHEDDKDIKLPSYAETRYLAASEFGSVGQYCFGNYLAMVYLNEGCRITVIENPDLRDTWSRMFNSLWRAAGHA